MKEQSSHPGGPVKGKSFRDLFEAAERDPAFHKELAILEFTEELVRVMHEQGVTPTELARRIGSSQAYVSRVLNGGANFTLGSMTKLAMGLGMDLKMHLSPADAVTVWRDYYPGSTRTSEARGQVISVELSEAFSEAPGVATRFASAPATTHAGTELAIEGTDRGATTAAA